MCLYWRLKLISTTWGLSRDRHNRSVGTLTTDFQYVLLSWPLQRLSCVFQYRNWWADIITCWSSKRLTNTVSNALSQFYHFFHLLQFLVKFVICQVTNFSWSCGMFLGHESLLDWILYRNAFYVNQVRLLLDLTSLRH